MWVTRRLAEKGECNAMVGSMLDLDSIAPERIRGLSRREYDELVERGHFDDEPIELLRGMLVTMSPQGDEHHGLTFWFTKRLTLGLGAEWDVHSQLPFAATDDSEPEPDILVTPTTTDVLRHPSSAFLVIEIARSSIRKDREVKAAIYAEAMVPEYWIVDVSEPELRVEVRRGPAADGYQTVDVLRDGDVLKPLLLPIEIPVLEIPWKR